MQATLVILVLAWSLKAYAFEDLPAIKLDQASGTTLEGSQREFPFVPDHVLSESLTGQKAELNTQVSEFMSTVMIFLERLSSEMSLLKEQVVKDRENLANLSSSVEILTQKVASLNVEVEVMTELARECRNISDRLSTLERNKGTIADEDRVQQGCETSFQGSGLDQLLTTKDPKVFGEPLYEKLIPNSQEESRGGSGEDMGEENREGSGEDGESTFQESMLDHLFNAEDPEMLEELLYEGLIIEFGESRERSEEGSGEDDVYVKSRSLVLQRSGFEKNYLISTMKMTSEKRLVMYDYMQQTLDMKEINGSRKFPPVSGESAGCMALLSNGLLATTLSHSKKIVFYNVSGDYLQVVGTVSTARDYQGIAQVGDSEQLVVSHYGGNHFYSVDILNFRGQLVRHVRNGSDIRYPNHLSYIDGDVFISDWAANRLHRLNLATGELLSTTSTTIWGQEVSLYQPRQSAVDDKGNLFLATGGGACRGLATGDPSDYWCVMLLTRNGIWKKLIDVRDDDKTTNNYPYGVAVSGGHLYVSYANWDLVWSTRIIEYRLGYR